MKLFYLSIILFCLSFSDLHGQKKIKYKNLFPILQSKDYASGEPMLIQFLQENNDEANAYFYLAEITLGKLDSTDIFPTTNLYDSLADLAISAYKKSISLIDEKEVKRNDDYYMAYNRRDLRTGKFGIKLSDVHLDYENKIQLVAEKRKLVSDIHEQKDQAKSTYDELATRIETLYQNYPSADALMLRADQAERNKLEEIIKSFDSFTESYTVFIDQLNKLGNPEYIPGIEFISIQKWEDLLPVTVDFESNNIRVKAYDQYFSNIIDQIDNFALPLKKNLLALSNQFDQAIQLNQNVSDSANLQALEIPVELLNNLLKVDQNEVILKLLQYKLLKNKANIIINNHLNPVLNDSSNIYQRANLLMQYEEILAEGIALLQSVEAAINQEIKSNFSELLNEYHPSIDAFLVNEVKENTQKLKLINLQNAEMTSRIEYLRFESESIYVSEEIANQHQHTIYANEIIEMDSILLFTGNWNGIGIIGQAGFDMQVTKLYKKDKKSSVKSVKVLNGSFLVNLQQTEEATALQEIIYFSPNLDHIWTYSYNEPRSMGDAKIEAGIFFLYDENGSILKTLNGSGQEIGN